jgi:ribosomal protein S18 acetylase RimI-like enzyme
MIVELWAETNLGGAHRGDNQKIIEESLSMGGKLLVATLPNGKVVGTSWMTFDGRRVHLHHFGVKPQYQMMGIGKMLTVESIKFAKEKGYQIKLEVHKDNTAAINLYKSFGFKYLGDYDVYIIRSFD